MWGKGLQKKVGGLEFCQNHHWEIFVSYLVRDGVVFLFIIVDFSVISLIKADIFSLFHRGAFPEKAVSTLKLSSSTFLRCRVICIYKDQYNNYI
jgi:hypothetical protein